MNASFVYPENTPTTKEAYCYRTIFEKFFPKVRVCLHVFNVHKSWVDFVSLPPFINICSFLLVSGIRCSSMLYFDGQSWSCYSKFSKFPLFS